MAPAGTPQDIVDKVAHEVAVAVKDPGFAARLSDYGVDPLGDTPAEYKAMLAHDISMWTEALDVAGVKQQDGDAK